MSLSLIKEIDSSKSDLLIGENYEYTLNQSIQNLLAEIHKKFPKISHFVNGFYDLMQAKTDPPLESIWLYSGLSFRSCKIPNCDFLDQVMTAKDLFGFISACSASCNCSKSIALLAPVVFLMYKVVARLVGRKLGSKRDRKAMREIKSLINVVLGYVSVCCCKDSSEECDFNLIMRFEDLVSVWMDGNASLKTFLPLVSDEICGEIGVESCGVNYLAGVVIVEMFLLKLCLNIRLGTRGLELEKELMSWAVGSITGFQNFYFFDILVRMLLEPTSCVTSLLSSEDEIILRRVLYDAVLLVEYSFLSAERAIRLPAEHVTSLAMKRLIITHEAIEYFRQVGDQRRAISYTSAFSGSQLPSHIIKCVTRKIGTEEKASGLNRSSPKALIKWLLMLEGKGLRVFDDSISKNHAKLALDNLEANDELPASKAPGKSADTDLLFYIDNKGEEAFENEHEEESKKSINTAFLAAAHSMKLKDNSGRKRKDGGNPGKKKKIKFLKYELSENLDSGSEILSAGNDGFSSGSEVENPVSEEDAETNGRVL